ncbi:hypothetical protein ACFSTH_05625 [Paenibacillus yanchengensis]
MENLSEEKSYCLRPTVTQNRIFLEPLEILMQELDGNENDYAVFLCVL